MINSNPTNWLDIMIKECNEYPVDIVLKHLDGNIYTIGNAPQTHEVKVFKLRSIL